MTGVRSELKSAGYEIFIGILSVLSIVNLVLMYAIDSDALDFVLAVMNALFSVIFLADFILRLSTAPSRAGYFFRQFGWADLLASLPFPQLKLFRIFRIVRVVRLFRKGGADSIGRTLVDDLAGSALLVLLLMGILVLQFGSLTVLFFEEGAPGANITTGGDAIWYTIVTISTVGYGDQYPVTLAGRITGTMIIVVGVGIFGTFTGFLANLFLTPRKKRMDAAADANAAAADSTLADAPAADAAPGSGGAVVSPETIDEIRALLARSEASLAQVKALLSGPAT